MISHPSRHCTVELQALPSRIGQVRRIVSAQLRYWHMDALIDRAALGVTELLSNVHRHARPDKSCTVELELAPDRLTVSVRDNDPRLPVPADAAVPPDAGPLATCGRGLAMVAAVSESWGARPDGENGKVVWFTLSAPAVVRPHPASVPRRPAEPRPTARVTPVHSTIPVAAAAPVSAATPIGAVAPVAAASVGAVAPGAAGTPVGAAATGPAVAHVSGVSGT
ncbi:ATP-binding protein [Streptomyces sp. NPDC001135]